MSDLSYTIEVKGVQDLDKLGNVIDKLTGTLNAGAGSGKSLEELRKILVGLKGKGSALEELATAAKGFTDATAEMRKGIGDNFKGLERLLKSEFKQLAAVMQTSGATAGAALGTGVAAGIKDSTTEIKKAADSAAKESAAAAKSVAVAMNNATGNFTRYNPKSGLKGGESLSQAMRDEQARYLRTLRAMAQEQKAEEEKYAALRRDSFARGKILIVKAAKDELKAQTDLLTQAEADEQARYQRTLQSMAQRQTTEQEKFAALRKDSFARGKILIVKAAKDELKAQTDLLTQAERDEQARYQRTLQSMAQRQTTEQEKFAALRKDSFARGKILIVKAAKDELKSQTDLLTQAERDEQARYQRTLQSMAQQQKAEQERLAALRKDSFARGKILIVKAAKDELKAQTDQIIANAESEAKRLKSRLEAIGKQFQQLGPQVLGPSSNLRSGALNKFTPTVEASSPNLPGLPPPAEQARALGFFERYQKALKDLSSSGGGIRRLGDDMGYLHSASRGVASGFNLMWLTWGQLAPLFVGAGLSNAFVQTAKTGMDVAHSFAIIQNVGGATAAEISALKDNLDELARTGHVAPEQIAEAMKTLSLAGLDANKILAVTGDVMNFSVAGTTQLQTAASTLMAVSTAFNMGAEGFARVGDVISKAAAESMTSVESFSEAMKTASVINAQYGVTLEDTATGIALLSQLGIQGSAAGTALRNMYADLSGRSIQVAKLLKAQGIEMRTATGAFRPMIEVVAELDKKLGDLTGIGQKNLLQGLLSERGAKPIIEALRLIRSNVDTTGTVFSNKLEEMRAKIEDSAGFMAVAAAKMSLSSKNQFESLGATMKNSLNNAFKEMEPQLLLIFERMKQAFSSPEFQSGLLLLTNAVANFTLILAENAKTVTYLVGAYVALKTAQFVLGATGSALVSLTALLTAAKTKETVAVAANTVALTANAAAGAAAARATGAAGVGGALLGLGRIIPGINIAVGLGTAAWMAYELWSSRSKDAASDAAELYDNKISSRLRDEADKLERVNALLAQGLSLREATARAESTTGLGDSTASIDATKTAYLQNLQAINNYRAALKAVQGTDNQHYVPSMLKELRRLEDNGPKLSKALRDALGRGQQIDSDIERVNRESQRKAEFLAKELEARQKQLNSFGSKEFELGGPGSDRESIKAVSAVRQNLMKETEEANRNELASIKAHYDSKQKLLKSEVDNQLITQGEFVLREIALTEESEAKQLAALTAGSERYFQAYETQAQALLDTQVKWEKLNADASKEAKEKQFQDTQTALDNLARDYTTTITKMGDDARAIKNNAFERLQLSINKARGELVALDKQFKDFWKAEENNAKKLQRQTAKEDSLRYATPEQAAMIEATSAEFERFQSRIEEVDKQILLMNNSYQAMLALKKGVIAPTREEQVQFDLLRQSLEKLNAERDKLLNAQSTGSSKAGQDALTKYAKDEAKRLQDGLSDSIMTALFEGGKAGSKKLRDLVVNELKKPIKLVLDVVANVIMSSLGMGAAGSAVAGSATGSAGSSFLSSAAGGLSGNLLTGGVGMSGMAGFTSGLSAWGAGGSVMGVLSNPGLYSLAEIAGALGPIALGVGAILLLAKKSKTPGEQHTGGFYSSSGKTGMDAALGITDGTESWARDLIKRANPEIEGMVKTTVDGVIKATTAKAKILGMDIAVGIDAGLAFNTNGKARNKNAFGYFDVTINGETVAEYVNRELGTDLKEAATTWTTDMTNAVSEWILGGETAAKELAITGENATQTLDRLTNNLTAANGAFESLGYTLFDSSVAGAKLATELIDAFGSVDTFTQLAGSFYQNFYSDSEKFSTSQRLLQNAFAELNIAVPQSSQGFRALIDSAVAAGDSGLVASLMKLAPAFYEVANAVETAFESIRKTTDSSVRDIKMSVLDDKGKYSFLDAEIESDLTKLSKASTPAEVESLFNKINSNITSAYGLLSPSEQQRLSAEFIDRLYKAEAAAQARLKITQEEADANVAADKAERKEIAAMERKTAEENLAAATLQRQAAERMWEAANRPILVNVNGTNGSQSQVYFS